MPSTRPLLQIQTEAYFKASFEIRREWTVYQKPHRETLKYVMCTTFSAQLHNACCDALPGQEKQSFRAEVIQFPVGVRA